MFNRDNVRDTLRADIVTVEFTKADGTLRKMRCTLQESYLPEAVTAKTVDKEARKEVETALAVWDLDNVGWRSFRIDSIKSITVE